MKKIIATKIERIRAIVALLILGVLCVWGRGETGAYAWAAAAGALLLASERARIVRPSIVFKTVCIFAVPTLLLATLRAEFGLQHLIVPVLMIQLVVAMFYFIVVAKRGPAWISESQAAANITDFEEPALDLTSKGSAEVSSLPSAEEKSGRSIGRTLLTILGVLVGVALMVPLLPILFMLGFALFGHGRIG